MVLLLNTGKMIKRRRQDLDWKVQELAAKVGVNPTYITQIERYNKLPSLKVITKIAKTLGLFTTKMEGVGLTLMEQYFFDKGESDEVVEHLDETVSTLQLELNKTIIVDDLTAIAKHTAAPTRKKLEQHIKRLKKEQKEIKKILDQLSKKKK